MSGLTDLSVDDVTFDFNDFSCRGLDGECANLVHDCGFSADAAEAHWWHSFGDTIPDVREVIGVC